MNKFLLDKKYTEIEDYTKYKNFKLEGVEAFFETPTPHLTLEVETHFFHDFIEIRYNKKDCLLALWILVLRVEDPSFELKKIIIVDKIYYDIKDLNSIFEYIYITNSIKIFPKTIEDMEYARDLIVFPINSKHADAYYLRKELERMNQLKTSNKQTK